MMMFYTLKKQNKKYYGFPLGLFLVFFVINYSIYDIV